MEKIWMFILGWQNIGWICSRSTKIQRLILNLINIKASIVQNVTKFNWKIPFNKLCSFGNQLRILNLINIKAYNVQNVTNFSWKIPFIDKNGFWILLKKTARLFFMNKMGLVVILIKSPSAVFQFIDKVGLLVSLIKIPQSYFLFNSYNSGLKTIFKQIDKKDTASIIKKALENVSKFSLLRWSI